MRLGAEKVVFLVRPRVARKLTEGGESEEEEEFFPCPGASPAWAPFVEFVGSEILIP